MKSTRSVILMTSYGSRLRGRLAPIHAVVKPSERAVISPKPPRWMMLGLLPRMARVIVGAVEDATSRHNTRGDSRRVEQVGPWQQSYRQFRRRTVSRSRSLVQLQAKAFSMRASNMFRRPEEGVSYQRSRKSRRTWASRVVFDLVRRPTLLNS